MPVIGNGVVVDPEVLLDEIDGLDERGVDISRLRDLRRRAPDHAAPPGAGPGHRALPRHAPDRHHRPRHRPGLRRQGRPHRHPGRRTCSTRASCARSWRARCGRRTRSWSRSTTARRSTSTRWSRSTPRTPSGSRPHIADTRLMLDKALDAGESVLLEGAQAHPARRRPRHVPLRDLVQPDRRRRLRRAPASARPGSRGSSASSRRTPPASAPGPFPTELFDETASTCARSAASSASPPAGPRRCGWFDAVVARYASRVNGFTDLLRHQAGRADRPGDRCRSAWPTTSTACGTTKCR